MIKIGGITTGHSTGLLTYTYILTNWPGKIREYAGVIYNNTHNYFIRNYL